MTVELNFSIFVRLAMFSRIIIFELKPSKIQEGVSWPVFGQKGPDEGTAFL